METMNDKITHGLTDTPKARKEWPDNIEEMQINNDSMTSISVHDFERLKKEARQGINYKTIEMVDGWTIEDLVDNVKRYENVLRDISNQVGKRASDLARVAAEALETNKEKVKNE